MAALPIPLAIPEDVNYNYQLCFELLTIHTEELNEEIGKILSS